MATTMTTAHSMPNTFTLTVPKADVSFFKTMAKKMGWMIERKSKKSCIQKPKEYDITKTAGYRAAMEDVKHGRVTTYASLDDFYKEMGL